MTHFANALRALYFVCVMALLLPFGSVDPIALHTGSFGMFALAALVLLVMPVAPHIRGLVYLALILCASLMAWIWMQSGNLFGTSSLWADAASVLGVSLQGARSIQPADTLAASIQVAAPFASFICGLVLFSDDRQATLLLKALVSAAVALAVIGMVQFILFPDLLLVFEKLNYRDSLTLMFVNRNTAATYLGVILIICAGSLVGPLRVVFNRLRHSLVYNSPFRVDREVLRPLPYLAATGVILTALMLTQSRAGIAATLAGLVVTSSVIIQSTPKDGRKRRKSRRSLLGPAIRVAIAVFLVGGVGLVLAGRALFRAQVYGGEDMRFCMFPGMLKLLQDNWLFGTGLSTFRDAFAPYREPICGIYGLWDMAHNFFLEGWVTLGAIFPAVSTIVIVVLASVFITGIGRRRRMRWYAAAGIGALVTTAAHSAIDFSLQIPGFAVSFAAVMAACAAISSRDPSSSGDSEAVGERTLPV